MSWLLPCLSDPARVSTPQPPAPRGGARIDRGAALGDRGSPGSNVARGRFLTEGGDVVLRGSMPSSLRDSLQRAGVDTRGVGGTASNLAEVDAITSKFDGLRVMTLSEAEGLGFRDAAHHADPTVDLFERPLTLTDTHQLVIGLSQVAADPEHGYDAEAKKGVVFMDMSNLARYLADNPRHPFTQVTLNAENINRYAFRVGLQ